MLSDDELDDSDSPNKNAAQFPNMIEISTDVGGAFLLPSGAVLVDHLSRGSGEVQSNKGLHTVYETKSAKVKTGGKGGVLNPYCEDSLQVDSRSSDPSDEPSSPQMAERQSSSPLASKDGWNGSYKNDCLPAVQETFSATSEDPTFNSYAPSDLSSAMSNLEIQQLLLHGKQQQYDLPLSVGGSESERKGKTMVLYANQSLCHPPAQSSHVNREAGAREDDRTPDRSQNNGLSLLLPPILSSVSPNTQEISSALPLPPPLPLMEEVSVGSLPHEHYEQIDHEEECTLGSEYMMLPTNQRYTQVLGQHHAVPSEQFYPQLIPNNSSIISVQSMTSTITSVPLSTLPGQHYFSSALTRGEHDDEYATLPSSTPLASPPNVTHATPAPSIIEVENMVEIVASSTELSVEVVASPSDLSPKEDASRKSRGSDQQMEEAKVVIDRTYSEAVESSEQLEALLRAYSEAAEESKEEEAVSPSVHSGSVKTPFAREGKLDDGYSADMSNSVNLHLPHNIDECSDGGSAYFGEMDLHHGCPMQSEEEEERSATSVSSGRQHYGGYGHTYDTRPLAAPPIAASRLLIPPYFPSLMDSSVSSALSESTSMSFGMHSGDHQAGTRELANIEEREDTLLPLDYRGVHLVPSKDNKDFILPDDPLTAASTPLAMPLSGGTDSRIAIDYDRHYIVDLERINEESSGNGASSPRLNRSPTTSTVGNDVSQCMQAVPVLSAEHAAAVAARRALSPIDNSSTLPLSQNFYNYRHKYYTEQYHYVDEGYGNVGTYHGSRGNDDDTSSTCSSVTLSQAFRESLHSEEHNSVVSEVTTDSSGHTTDYPEQHSNSLISAVSSITLSKSLSVDHHDHSEHGFYVATRLGDYVEVLHDGKKPVEEEETESGNLDEQETESGTKTSGDSSEGFDVSSDDSAPLALDDKKAKQQLAAARAGDVESDVLSALLPDCSAPMPSVVAKVRSSSASRTLRSTGGMLLPWHSARSIQNYQSGPRSKNKSRRGSTRSTSDRSIFSTGSVRAFRG